MKSLKDIEISDYAEVSKSFSKKDVLQFAELSGDWNPIHVDEKIAAESIFGKQVIHGILLTGLISGLLGSELPGSGSIYLAQSLKFMKPVFIDEKVIARVEVVQVIHDKGIIILKSTCRTLASGIVLEGESTILLRDVK